MPKFSYQTQKSEKNVIVDIGSGTLNHVSHYLADYSKIGVIIDENVEKLHKENICRAFSDFDVTTIVFTSKEENKSFASVEKIAEQLLASGFGRDSLLIGIGGGILTDVCGFTAAILNRGIPYLNIPTTLLGMVDASIGGKTGVNTKTGKNLLGAIKQPEAILMDIQFLDTLPKKIFLEGISESLKIALAMDEELLSFMKLKRSQILSKDKEALLEMIERSARLKSEVVQKDDQEKGLRQILNFGHTFGHAFEKLSDFQISHGDAVSIGIMGECYLSHFEGHISEKLLKEVKETLVSFGLPVSLHGNFKNSDLLNAMISDKKSLGGTPRFVILEGSGRVRQQMNQFSFEARLENIKKALKAVSQND